MLSNSLPAELPLGRVALVLRRCVAKAASRMLRNDIRALLQRVEAGEEFTITVDGRAVAILKPVVTRPSWIASSELVRRLAVSAADPGLTGSVTCRSARR